MFAFGSEGGALPGPPSLPAPIPCCAFAWLPAASYRLADRRVSSVDSGLAFIAAVDSANDLWVCRHLRGVLRTRLSQHFARFGRREERRGSAGAQATASLLWYMCVRSHEIVRYCCPGKNGGLTRCICLGTTPERAWRPLNKRRSVQKVVCKTKHPNTARCE